MSDLCIVLLTSLLLLIIWVAGTTYEIIHEDHEKYKPLKKNNSTWSEDDT